MSRRVWLFSLALIVVTFLVYAPAWNGRPIWDDERHMTPVELRSLNGLGRIWTEPGATPQYYPVLHTLFWLEDKLWDGSVLPYHLVTIFFHALLALLVMLILRRLDLPGARLAAILFALHPVHVESVAWFSEIKNTLSGVFAAAAVLAYLKYDGDRRWGAYIGALTFFAFGLLTKTAVVALPVVLLIIFWWRRGSLGLKRDVLPLLPFLALGLAAGIVTIWVERRFCAVHETFDFSLLDRFLIAGRLFWFYLGKIFWPTNLSLIYARWTIDSAQWWQYTFAIGAIGLAVGLWLLRRKSRGPLAVCLSFVAFLFPVLGFFNLSFFMSSPAGMPHSGIFRADHFQYLADVPIIAFVSATAVWLWQRTRGVVRTIVFTACVLVIGTLGALSALQSRTYQDTETCFRDVLSKNSESATAYNNLGNVLHQKGEVDEAIVYYRRAVALEPDYQFGRYNLGSALAEQGNFAEAIPWLKAVLRTDPNHAKAYYTLANALAKHGEPDEAIGYYGRALKLMPDFADAHCNLANLLLEKGNTTGALEHYRELVRLQPQNPGAHYNLAVGLVHNGEPAAAISELRTALQIDPAYPDAEPLLRDLLAQKTPP